MKKITITSLCILLRIFTAEAQTAAWAHAIGGEDQGEIGTTVRVDAQGNTYVAGMYRGEVKFDPNSDNYTFTSPDSGGDAFVEKFDANGNFLWVKVFNSPVSMEETLIELDAQGNVYVVANFLTEIDLDPGQSEDIRETADWAPITYIVKLDSNGNYIFGKTFESMSENAGAATNTMAIAPDGSILLGGLMQMSIDFDPGAGTNIIDRTGETPYLVKLDSNGNFEWVKMFTGTSRRFSCMPLNMTYKET